MKHSPVCILRLIWVLFLTNQLLYGELAMSEVNSSLKGKMFSLPLRIYLIKGANFSKTDIEYMIQRTDKKLTSVGIKLDDVKIFEIDRPDFAVVDNDNLENILNIGLDSPSLRVFLIHRTTLWEHESWTFDPLPDDQFLNYKGAIFITDVWADNSDTHYEDSGYMASCDTLLHELGHVLMQKSEHFDLPAISNFFHEQGKFSDDSITLDQKILMRNSPYLKFVHFFDR